MATENELSKLLGLQQTMVFIQSIKRYWQYQLTTPMIFQQITELLPKLRSELLKMSTGWKELKRL